MVGNFGDDFFSQVLGRDSNPIREFMATMPEVGKTLGNEFLKMPDFGFGGKQGEYGNFAPDITQFVMPQSFAPSRLAPQTPTQKPQAASASQGRLAAAIDKAQKPKTPANVGDSDLQVDTSSPWYARAVQIAQEEGLDPVIFTRLVAQESKFDPGATSAKGARGLTQLMPDTAAGLGVTDAYDPEQALRGGARYLKQNLDRYGGDYTMALAAYNAGPGNVDTYGGIPPFSETQDYVRRIMGTPKAPAAPAAADSSSAFSVPEPGPGVRPLKGITTYQYGEEGLATGAADYICGPIAAQAFLKSQGRNPTLRESLDLARQLGIIDERSGMHGVDSTVALIRKLGGVATRGQVSDREIQAELAAGRPVIIDTDAGSRGHYFVIEGYDAETGKYDFGNSARALRASGGNTMYSLNEIQSLGFGAPHAAIYAR